MPSKNQVASLNVTNLTKSGLQDITELKVRISENSKKRVDG
jgi:hypothetical protein